MNKHKLLRAKGVFFGCGAGLLAAAAFGQGSFQPVVMQTGTGGVLQTQVVPYTSGADAFLSLDFGFATEETAQPGAFADSFTVSVTGPDGTAYLVTIDANGAAWAPSMDGAVPVLANALQHSNMVFAVSTQGLAATGSYHMDYSLPANWQGMPLNVTFDFFDNQDPNRSLAYYKVNVPEPGCLALGLASLALCPLFRRLRLTR